MNTIPTSDSRRVISTGQVPGTDLGLGVEDDSDGSVAEGLAEEGVGPQLPHRHAQVTAASCM